MRREGVVCVVNHDKGDNAVAHAILSERSFWSLLLRLDEERAAEVRALGCPHCGAPLHSARYPRKPRGQGREVLGPEYERRFSLCCSRKGCRLRTTPPSVRFFGRRVYLGAVVVLRTALSHGLNARRVACLVEVLGVSRRTLQRWRRWWLREFPQGPWWRALQGRFARPLEQARLPASLLECCGGQDEQRQLVWGLEFLAGRWTSSSRFSMPGQGPQNLPSVAHG